jgi:hypothetical protein
MVAIEMASVGAFLWGLPALLWSPKPINVAILGAAIFGLIGVFQQKRYGVIGSLLSSLAVAVIGAFAAAFLQAITFFTSGVPLVTSMLFGAYIFSIIGATWPEREWENFKKWKWLK